MEKSLEREREREKQIDEILFEIAPRFDGQEFLPAFYVGIFAWKLIDSIYRRSRIEM